MFRSVWDKLWRNSNTARLSENLSKFNKFEITVKLEN